MGYELWKNFEGIAGCDSYPTARGLGHRHVQAFDEMQEMGWIGAGRPRMVRCRRRDALRYAKAWEAHRNAREFFAKCGDDCFRIARARSARDLMMLRMLRQTNGTALT